MQFQYGEPLVVIDFETTGMSPEQGDRAIEVGAVMVREQKIVDRYSSLINPGFRVSREIEGVTGITNLMLADAPAPPQVMEELLRFIGTFPLVAHNASFDQKFFEAELAELGKKRPLNFGCTLKVARRIYPDLPNYKLETLVRHHNIPVEGQFHRALADAEMTAGLWIKMVSDLQQQYGFATIPFEVLQKLGKTAVENVPDYLTKTAEELRQEPQDTTGNLFF